MNVCVRDNLKRFRQAKGLNQTELARELKVAPSTISMIEQGKRLPSLEFAVRLANFFDVSLDEFIGDLEPA